MKALTGILAYVAVMVTVAAGVPFLGAYIINSQQAKYTFEFTMQKHDGTQWVYVAKHSDFKSEPIAVMRFVSEYNFDGYLRSRSLSRIIGVRNCTYDESCTDLSEFFVGSMKYSE